MSTKVETVWWCHSGDGLRESGVTGSVFCRGKKAAAGPVSFRSCCQRARASSPSHARASRSHDRAKAHTASATRTVCRESNARGSMFLATMMSGHRFASYLQPENPPRHGRRISHRAHAIEMSAAHEMARQSKTFVRDKQRERRIIPYEPQKLLARRGYGCGIEVRHIADRKRRPHQIIRPSTIALGVALHGCGN